MVKRAINICHKRDWTLTAYIRKFIKSMPKTTEL